MRILIVEDEPYMAEAIEQVLKKNNYSIDIAYDGEYGLDCALSQIYDAIILDIMLPKLDGFQVIKKLRAQKITTPIILLTAKDALDDRVLGLDSGADDYLTKPFQMAELMARIRALIRRQPQFKTSNCYEHEDIILYPLLLKLWCKNNEISLTLKESQILEVLLLNKNQIVSKNTLIEKVWGYESDTEDNHVEVYISFLRKKLDHLDSTVTIDTKRRLGYIISNKME